VTDFAELPKRWQQLLTMDDATLADVMVTAPDREMKSPAAAVTAGRHPLPDHLVKLEREHVDRPKATLCHAALVVLIRREMVLDAALTRYFALWEAQTDLLLSKVEFALARLGGGHVYQSRQDRSRPGCWHGGHSVRQHHQIV